MKKLSLENGIILSHPFELAELIQNHSAENIDELISLLFSSYGVLNAQGKELLVYADSFNIFVNPGRGLCAKGFLNVQESLSISTEGLELGTKTKWWVNLIYESKISSPYYLKKFGSLTGNFLYEDNYRIEISDTAISLSDGIPLATFVPKEKDTGIVFKGELKRGSIDLEITDVRSDYVASFRPYYESGADYVDPALVPDINKFFSKEDIVDDIFNLLDNNILNGEEIVTRALPASQPLFLDQSFEPAYREYIRLWNSVGATGFPRPDPHWRWRGRWNAYGILATKTTAHANGNARVIISSPFDIESINIQEGLPVYLRYDSVDWEIEEIESANTIRLTEPFEVGRPASDSNSALHNGGEEFYVMAHSPKMFLGNENSSFVFDDLDGYPLSAELLVPPGEFQISIQSVGQKRKGIYSFPSSFPGFPSPPSGHTVTVSGETTIPGTSESIYGGEGAFQKANPFSKLPVGTDGDPVVNTSKLNEYVEAFEKEITRVQETDVSLLVTITPPGRLRSTRSSNSSITVGYKVVVDILTATGWKEREHNTFYRTLEDVSSEIAWIDINSNRYRGEVDDPTDFTGQANINGRPFQAGDIMYASLTDTGIFRYEPFLKSTQIAGLDTEPAAANSSDDEGYWVRVFDDIDEYTAEPLVKQFSNLQGGSDYRVRVFPISESDKVGASIDVLCDDLREAYNSKLGFDYHKAIVEMNRISTLLFEQVDPSQIAKMIEEKAKEIREIIDRASVYGNPPKVDGPVTISATPTSTTFSGTSLGSVTNVFMRYIPANTNVETVIPMNFKVVIGSGSEASIVIPDLPALASLSISGAPSITLEFNAGIQGRDYITVFYETVSPKVFSPSVGSFGGSKEVSIGTHKVNNTASYYKAITTLGYLEITGPYAKDWTAPTAEVYPVHPPLNTASTAVGYSEASWISSSSDLRTLTFATKDFLHDSILDVRIRSLPSDSLVKGIWYGPDALIDDQKDILEKGDIPVYQQLVINETGIILVVHKDLVPIWTGKNFALDYIYYDGTPDVGKDDCKGLILNNRGTSSGAPVGTPQEGWYYKDTSDGEFKVYRSSTWANATPLIFLSHTFSISSFGTGQRLRKEANVKVFMGVPYQGPAFHPQYKYAITQPYSKMGDIHRGDYGDMATLGAGVNLDKRLVGASETLYPELGYLQEQSHNLKYDEVDVLKLTIDDLTAISGKRKDNDAVVSLDLMSLLILVNGTLVENITGTFVSTGIIDIPIRDYMKDGGGVTVEIIPMFE